MSELERMSEAEKSQLEPTPELVEVFEVAENPDPITGEPGSHPVGTGIGAAATGAIATAIGATAGPIGAIAGAVVGSVIGGLVGKSAAENANPSGEVVVSELEPSVHPVSEAAYPETDPLATAPDRIATDQELARREPILPEEEYERPDIHPQPRNLI